ncbi:MAG: twitching motility protein PilT [Eubacterium sp.]|nr:twitching motility protein PilT [Eubacterium sp.]
MVKIICGAKGKGKTKEMLTLAAQAVQDVDGSVVYIDKSDQHMYELNNQIRLIDISEYPVNSSDSFLGFVSGLLAGNHDIEMVFIDSLLKLSALTASEIATIVDKLDALSNTVEFVVSISANKDDLPDSVQDKIVFSC